MPEQGKPTDRYGSVVTRPDGQKYVRFVRHLSSPIDTVWAALTDQAQIDNWFPGLKLDPRLGGTFEIWFGGECEGPAHVTGTVTVFDPPRTLALGTMRWELEPAGNHCVLTFSDILAFDGRDPTEFMHSVLGGWHKYLDAFERALAGESSDPRQLPDADYSEIDITVRD